MYHANQYVFHKSCGICLIQSISPLAGDTSGKLFYVLSPLFGEDKGNIVRVPVSNSSSLQDPITREEAMDMVSRLPPPDTDFYIADSKKRKLAYEDALQTGSLENIAKLLRGAMQRKNRDGHLNSMDGQFVSRAEPLLFGSFSMALGINYGDVGKFLTESTSRQN